jgi:ribosomal protein S13
VIKNLFANLNQILAGLTRLGAKYAGTICELTNYDNQIEIQTLLETECYKVLADIQKEIKDWITAEEL